MVVQFVVPPVMWRDEGFRRSRYLWAMIMIYLQTVVVIKQWGYNNKKKEENSKQRKKVVGLIRVEKEVRRSRSLALCTKNSRGNCTAI